ncbi:MAG: hypothetical protein EOO04_29880, partial [Chitinophagaceae bacterium]
MPISKILCKEAWINPQDLKYLDIEKQPIPLVNEDEWQLCKKLHGSSTSQRFGEVTGIQINRGEINQTVYRKYISSKSAGCARLLKGVEVGPFELRDKMRQGTREWFNEKAYLKVSAPKSLSSLRRIATQRISGVDDRLRVIAAIVEPSTYFADSTNSIAIVDECPYSLEYVCAMLNSDLYQWRFRLTSTNNNVGTGEMEAMPFRAIDFTSKKDKLAHDSITKNVKELMQLKEKFLNNKAPNQ